MSGTGTRRSDDVDDDSVVADDDDYDCCLALHTPISEVTCVLGVQDKQNKFANGEDKNGEEKIAHRVHMRLQ